MQWVKLSQVINQKKDIHPCTYFFNDNNLRQINFKRTPILFPALMKNMRTMREKRQLYVYMTT